MKLSIWFIIIFLSSSVYGGGWNKKKKQVYLRYSFRYVQADKIYDFAANKINQTTIKDFTNSLYMEYGLTDNITIVSYIPFFRGTVFNDLADKNGKLLVNGIKHSGLGDVDLGFRYGIKQSGPSVFALFFKMGIPTGANKHNFLLLGDGEFDFTSSLEFGHSFYPLAMYSAASIAYKKRSKGFSDELLANIEAGYNLSSDLLFSLKLRSSFLLGDIDNNSDWKNIFSQSEYLAYSFEMTYNFYKNVSFFLAFDAAFKAKNSLAAPAYSIGISL